MKKRLGRKLLSLIIAGMLFMNLPINVQAADEITVDFNRFNETNISWCNSAGEYGSGTKPDNCVFYVTSGGGTIKNGYSVALINVTSNRYIGQDEAYPLDNYGTIVSTDGCINYVNNGTTGIIIGGTFLNVIMTGGTIKNAIVKGLILCDEPGSEYVIENVTLEDGAKISVDGEPVAAGPGTYTVTVQNGEVTVEKETAPEEESAPETDNGSNNDSENNDSENNDSENNDSENNDSANNDSSNNDSENNDSANNDSENNDSANNDSSNNDSDAKPEKDTNEDKKQEEPQEPKESEEQIFTRELLTRAATAKAGDIVAIDATLWHSFNANVLKELLSKEEVSYTFYYNYGGECFYITIPAGAVLEEGCEWYGPLKLNAMFGRTMIDKKELHAAINK